MDSLPAVHPRAGLPASVTVFEVGPRDGLQAEEAVVPLEAKLEFIDRLGQAGLAVIEATEEAIYNSLFKATTISGKGRTVEALPLDRTLEILRKHGLVRQ